MDRTKLIMLVALVMLASCCVKKTETQITQGVKYKSTPNENRIKYEKPQSSDIAKQNVEQIADYWAEANPRKVFYFSDSSMSKLVYEVQYYESGKRKMEGSYQNGVREGKWVAWYENDTVWSIGYYKNGKRNGLSAVYHPNGVKYYDKNYKNDIAEGKWNFYNEDGSLVGEAYYHKGNLVKEVKY